MRQNNNIFKLIPDKHDENKILCSFQFTILIIMEIVANKKFIDDIMTSKCLTVFVWLFEWNEVWDTCQMTGIVNAFGSTLLNKWKAFIWIECWLFFLFRLNDVAGDSVSRLIDYYCYCCYVRTKYEWKKLKIEMSANDLPTLYVKPTGMPSHAIKINKWFEKGMFFVLLAVSCNCFCCCFFCYM